MLKLFALVCLLALPACGRHESQEATNPIDEARAMRDEAVAAFDPATIERCDFATFAGQFEAYTGKDIGFARLEEPAGHWNRHFAPCYPADSKADTSRDVYLSLALWAAGRPDRAAIAQRVVSWGEPRGWDMGEGPSGVVNITDFAQLFHKMSGTAGLVEGSADGLPGLSGFQGHVLSIYLLTRAKLYGSLSAAEVGVLKTLAAQTPESPYLEAVAHRFTDGDYTHAVDLAKRMKTCSQWWGSCHPTVYLAMAVGVMEGK